MKTSLPMCWLVLAGLPLHAEDKAAVLFNGKDLTGWQGMGGKPTNFNVENGVLKCTGGKGATWLATNEQYADFDLSLEFQLPRNGNSGVFIRAPKDGAPWVAGIEIQLLDDFGDKWKSLQPSQYTGSIYAAQAPSKRATKKAGQWQTMRILCVKRHCRVWVNGQQILDADLDKLAKTHGKKIPGLTRKTGYIGLQNHGDKVSFRKIRITPK